MSSRVLLVEDDPAIAVLIETLVIRAGFEIDVARNGHEGMQAILRQPYDAILTDLLMPKMSGFDLLARLNHVAPALLGRVIVTTAAPIRRTEPLLANHPVFGVMRKPFDIHELREMVEACIETSRSTAIPVAAHLRRFLHDVPSTRGGVIVRLDSNAACLEHVCSDGYKPGEAESFYPMSVDAHLPLCTAVRRRQPIFIASIKAAADYPMLRDMVPGPATHALAVAPLAWAQATGAIGWSFVEPRPFESEEQTQILEVAARCAEALNLDALYASGTPHRVAC